MSDNNVTVGELLDSIPIGGQLVKHQDGSWRMERFDGSGLLNVPDTFDLLAWIIANRRQSAEKRVLAEAAIFVKLLPSNLDGTGRQDGILELVKAVNALGACHD